MSEKSIDEVTPDTDVTGVEKLPVSDGGTPKSVTIEKVKDFVLAKINALDAATDITVANDGVFIKQDGALKPVSASTLASAIIAHAFGQDAPSALAGTDEVVISKSDVTKVTTLATLAQYVKDATGAGLVNFEDYGDTGSAALNDYLLVGKVDEGEWETDKITIDDLLTYVYTRLFSKISTSASTLSDDNDYLVVSTITDNSETVKRTKLSLTGLGKGDVKKSASQTADNELVRWDGANTKNVKGGITVTSTLNANSTESQVPNAALVYGKLQAIINSLTEEIQEEIESGESSTVIANAITTAITNALSENGAIRTQLDTCAKAPNVTTSGKIPVWSDTSKTLLDGKTLVEWINSPTNNQIPTALAVKNLHDSITPGFLVHRATMEPAIGGVPKWSSPAGYLETGYEVAISEIYEESRINWNTLATTQHVYNMARKAVGVSATAPEDGATGYKRGQMVYSTNSTTKGLYINTGDAESATWEQI